jgi:mono/diheme cytochrome c family protein
MRLKTSFLLAALTLSGSVAVIHAGGWCVVTLANVPTTVAAGRPVTLAYTVRQHGIRPVDGLVGRIEARKGDTVITSAAHKLPPDGTYDATLTFPEAGEWTLDIVSGAALSGHTLTLKVDVVERGTAPRQISAVDQGRQLFAGKGCAKCHTQAEFGESSLNFVNLSARKYTPEAVGAFLRKVQARPTDVNEYGRMPNLGLGDREIDALAAFLGR